jgi:raffinose/stachyose/melibiose transport system substrate-binding protein
MPIDDLLYDTEGPEGQDRMIDVFNETFMSVYKVGGKHYFFPYELATAGISYNKTLFGKYGLKPPKTWGEFIALNQTLKNNGIPPLALDGNINFYNAYYYTYLCLRVLGSGSFMKAAEDTTGAVWDDPGYLKAAQLTYELSKKGKDFFQPGYEGSSFPAAQVDWALGSAGSIMCGTWIPQETEELVADDWVFGCFSFPGVEGGKGKATELESSLYGFAILDGCKNPDGAKEFLKFLAKKENAQKYVDYTDLISARNDIDPPEMLADVKEMLENATGYFLTYDGVLGNQPEWFANVFYPLDNALVFGDITPEEFIKQIKQASIDYWARK